MFRLEAHPVARSCAVANSHIPAGSSILRETSLAYVLLSSQKGKRCDTCFRKSLGASTLKRCTGCASYWYCDAKCQTIQWQINHKQICKKYSRWIASPEYQTLAEHERMDAILLSHLVAQFSTNKLVNDENNSPPAVFLSLLPGPLSDIRLPPLCASSLLTEQRIQQLYSRFGNNNFVVHSHFTTVGHGIFPTASRSFNHSCLPNAAAKYHFTSALPPVMEMVALRDIAQGEEICLPYLDPALLQTRKQMLEFIYGFSCVCQSCLQLQPVPTPPSGEEAVLRLGKSLRDDLGLKDGIHPPLQYKGLGDLPVQLRSALHEDYLTSLSEIFSKSSHEGDYPLANDSGLILLALYTFIYPPNYPQIGIHLLELAKTWWNELVASSPLPNKKHIIEGQVKMALSLARGILNIVGPEGDEDGPLHEIETLQNLLDH
ncbi:hypothetical protein AMATHDRAFT_136523 [Amanita thiersii Skay4041]|uniref:MYND-type domain-containing protein n=1 Tax=Amanita thiersii Skay4041 TaxID=703135 RepID=A0A2A9NSV4_9AGAR|nr:hypothetical protein AMATHDRAFT_136523 [Amanita thiersii Skay4041]